MPSQGASGSMKVNSSSNGAGGRAGRCAGRCAGISCKGAKKQRVERKQRELLEDERLINLQLAAATRQELTAQFAFGFLGDGSSFATMPAAAEFGDAKPRKRKAGTHTVSSAGGSDSQTKGASSMAAAAADTCSRKHSLKLRYSSSNKGNEVPDLGSVPFGPIPRTWQQQINQQAKPARQQQQQDSSELRPTLIYGSMDPHYRQWPVQTSELVHRMCIEVADAAAFWEGIQVQGAPQTLAAAQDTLVQINTAADILRAAMQIAAGSAAAVSYPASGSDVEGASMLCCAEAAAGLEVLIFETTGLVQNIEECLSHAGKQLQAATCMDVDLSSDDSAGAAAGSSSGGTLGLLLDCFKAVDQFKQQCVEVRAAGHCIREHKQHLLVAWSAIVAAQKPSELLRQQQLEAQQQRAAKADAPPPSIVTRIGRGLVHHAKLLVGSSHLSRASQQTMAAMTAPCSQSQQHHQQQWRPIHPCWQWPRQRRHCWVCESPF